jgi:hypothetical protein
MSYKLKSASGELIGGMAASAFLLVSLLATTPRAIAGDLMYGDTDLSGEVNGGDLGLVSQCVSGLASCPGNSDAGGDDCSIKASDAFALQKRLAFSNVLPIKDPGNPPGCWAVGLTGAPAKMTSPNDSVPVTVTLSNNVSPPRGGLSAEGVLVDFTIDSQPGGCSLSAPSGVTDALGEATVALNTGSTLGAGVIYATVRLVSTTGTELNIITTEPISFSVVSSIPDAISITAPAQTDCQSQEIIVALTSISVGVPGEAANVSCTCEYNPGGPATLFSSGGFEDGTLGGFNCTAGTCNIVTQGNHNTVDWGVNNGAYDVELEQESHITTNLIDASGRSGLSLCIDVGFANATDAGEDMQIEATCDGFGTIDFTCSVVNADTGGISDCDGGPAQDEFRTACFNLPASLDGCSTLEVRLTNLAAQPNEKNGFDNFVLYYNEVGGTLVSFAPLPPSDVGGGSYVTNAIVMAGGPSTIICTWDNGVDPSLEVKHSIEFLEPFDTIPPGALAASPPGGEYCPPGVSVTLNCDDPVATIYYTTDGSEPATASPVYAGPIEISENTTLKFMAVDTCGNQAATVAEVYDIDISTIANVSITSPLDGVTVYAGSVMVTGTADTDISLVTVTSNQGHSESSPVVGGNWSVVLSGVTVPSISVTAQGTDACGNTGSDSVTVFVIPAVGSCNISSIGPTTGCSGHTVTINGLSFGTIEGTVGFDVTGADVISWSDISIVVSAPGGDYSNVTVMPMAAAPCSLIGTYSYDDQAPADLAAIPAGGSYCATPITVSLSASEGMIYYTLDGSGPTTGSSVYTEPLEIGGPTTLKFMAVDACGNQAATVTEVYEINIPQGDLEYLIITADGLAAEAEAIRAYRQGTCYVTGLLTMSEILAGMAGEDIVAELKMRISSAYEGRNSERPFFVLLVGDADEFPSTDPELIPVPSVNIAGKTVISDNWYADVDGDDIPDLAIGRLPFRESAEVALYLEKLKAYEGTYLPGEWNRRLSFFAGDPGLGEGGTYLIEVIAFRIIDRLPYTYNLNMTYGYETSAYFYVPEEFSDKVYERFNEGALAMTYIGHGTEDSLLPYVMGYPLLDTANLSALNPVGRAPIFNIIACLTGDFTYPTGSLSEMILSGDNGIVAVFSSTEISDPLVNAIVAMEVGAAVYGAQPETLGEGLMAAKDGIVNREGDDLRDSILGWLVAFYGVTEQQIVDMLIEHVHIYTLFGDPALAIAFPRGKILLTLDGQEYHAGETVFVDGEVDSVTDGQAIVSLEVGRQVIAYPIEEIDWDDPNVNDTIRTNYENANNKVLDSVEVEVTSGSFTASLALAAGLEPDTYHVKAYAYSTDGYELEWALNSFNLPTRANIDAVGCTKLDLIP